MPQSNYEVRALDLNLAEQQQTVTTLMGKLGFAMEPELDYAAGLFQDDQLVCFGGHKDRRIKSVVVDPYLGGDDELHEVLCHLYINLYGSHKLQMKEKLAIAC